MFKIDRPENISPMKSFFVGNNIPSKPIIYAILNGRNPGNIWIDDTNSPSRILIVSNAGYSFYSGSLSNLAVKNVINCCKQNTNIKLAVTLNQLEKIIKIYPDFDIIERTQLSFKNDHKSLKKIINNHVSNINFHKIKTSKLFNQCMWYNVMLEMYGSEDNFINNGIGFCLINNDALPNDFTRREKCYNLKYFNPNLTRPHQQVTRLVNSIKR